MQDSVRRQFLLANNATYLAGMLFASHPAPVRAAIARHRRGLDRDPAEYVRRNHKRLTRATRLAAAEYLGASPDELILTDSTTMGLGLVYATVDVRPGQELLTTEHDHYSTHRALALRSERTGVPLRRVRLYGDDLPSVDQEQLAARLVEAVRPNTRVVAVTWVHSNTGTKLPIARIGKGLEEINRFRSPQDRALLCVDGVHGLGVEAFESLNELGCDVFVAGTHKWLLGPRGTGLVWVAPRAQPSLSAIIPTFTRFAGWGGDLSPGGFHAFDHCWALAEAFRFQLELGKRRVQRHIHELAALAKEGLRRIPFARLRTPVPSQVSSGIVCFEVEGLSAREVVRRMRERGVVISASPYRPSFARISPAIYNDPADVERAVRELKRIR